jgi:hypothetical protein
MLSGETPEAEAQTETPAPSETEEKPAPASEPEITQNAAERGADGKFKPAPVDETPEGVKKRIGKALKAQREAEERADALEAELEKTRESRPAPAAKAAAETAPPAKAAEGKPQAKDFDTYEAFNEALVDWKLAQTRAADAKVATDRAAADANAAKGVAWNERVEAVRKVHADFDDVMAEAASLPISEAMHVTIFESERGPEVAYHLAQHPDEAARIAKLGPLAAARELGRLEAALPSATAKPAAAKPLPKPPAQAGGSHAPSAIDLNDDKLAPEVFAREFRKRLKAA